MFAIELVLFSLINDPFVYIIVSHENLDKSESFWFLNRLNVALEDFLLTGLVVGTNSLTQNCLQSHFDLVFKELMALWLQGDGLEVNDGDAKYGCGGDDDGDGEIVGMEKKYELTDLSLFDNVSD
ncbi:hypothetical protein J1N35_034751 [Gossypium stocksii]|uniref:Uncharacterized protein n=1 Tax=Gossypium stocksii TaxID=47602 RepID=A0A9D3USL9_9ROSI|nr:hypothetical protein J1N35_034751 [Gossypium stocksii]